MIAQNNNNRWTSEEDQQLLDLVNAEASWPLIAVTLKRSAQAVQERAQHLKTKLSGPG